MYSVLSFSVKFFLITGLTTLVIEFDIRSRIDDSIIRSKIELFSLDKMKIISGYIIRNVLHCNCLRKRMIVNQLDDKFVVFGSVYNSDEIDELEQNPTERYEQ